MGRDAVEFDLNDEQRTLRDETRRFLEAQAPLAYAREMMSDERGYRDDVWHQMASLGWMALPFPEAYDGLDQGFIALAIVLAEMGRVVLPGPYLSAVLLAGGAILEAGSDAQRKELLPMIATGELIAAYAYEANVDARRSGSKYVLNGEARFTFDGASASKFIVDARLGDERALFVADRGEARAVSAVDQTRKVADVRFDRTEADLLGEPGARARVLDRAAAGLAAEMLGGAERVLELSVAYAKDRVQFDRPIGSFQAVKHRAADMLLDVESLRSAVYYAAWAIERGHPDASLAASMAKAYASDAYRRVASSGIQIHGGIGFTWESDMHLFFKRAKTCEVAFGDATFHRERMAQILKQRYAPA